MLSDELIESERWIFSALHLLKETVRSSAANSLDRVSVLSNLVNTLTSVLQCVTIYFSLATWCRIFQTIYNVFQMLANSDLVIALVIKLGGFVPEKRPRSVATSKRSCQLMWLSFKWWSRRCRNSRLMLFWDWLSASRNFQSNNRLPKILVFKSNVKIDDCFSCS